MNRGKFSSFPRFPSTMPATAHVSDCYADERVVAIATDVDMDDGFDCSRVYI